METVSDNIKSQMRKGVLEYCILCIVKNQASYASDIINRLKEARMIVVEGTLYPLLTRQKNQGLLAYRWEESPQGPPRKYYSLTRKGLETLQEMELAWAEINSAIDLLHRRPAQEGAYPAGEAYESGPTFAAADRAPEVPQTSPEAASRPATPENPQE